MNSLQNNLFPMCTRYSNYINCRWKQSYKYNQMKWLKESPQDLQLACPTVNIVPVRCPAPSFFGSPRAFGLAPPFKNYFPAPVEMITQFFVKICIFCMKIRKIPTKCPAPPFSESPLLFRYAPPFKQNFLAPVLSAFQKFASPPPP